MSDLDLMRGQRDRALGHLLIVSLLLLMTWIGLGYHLCSR